MIELNIHAHTPGEMRVMAETLTKLADIRDKEWARLQQTKVAADNRSSAADIGAADANRPASAPDKIPAFPQIEEVPAEVETPREPATVPEEPSSKVTIEQVRKVLQHKLKDDVMALVKQFGVSKVSELPVADQGREILSAAQALADDPSKSTN